MSIITVSVCMISSLGVSNISLAEEEFALSEKLALDSAWQNEEMSKKLMHLPQRLGADFWKNWTPLESSIHYTDRYEKGFATFDKKLAPTCAALASQMNHLDLDDGKVTLTTYPLLREPLTAKQLDTLNKFPRKFAVEQGKAGAVKFTFRGSDAGRSAHDAFVHFERVTGIDASSASVKHLRYKQHRTHKEL